MRTAPSTWPPDATGTATTIRFSPSVLENRSPVAMSPARAWSISGLEANDRRAPGPSGSSESAIRRPPASTRTTRPPVSRW